MPYPCTSDVLCEALYKCLQSWQFDCKLSTLTLHGSSTDDALVPQIKAKIGPTNLLLGGRLLNMQCCAQSLDLVIKDGLEVIATTIEKIRGVAYYLATPERHGKFKEAALSQHVELTEELCLDSKSKWNSTYTMLRIALGYKKVFDYLKRVDENFTSCPTAEDWKSASSVFDRLEVFHELSEMFPGTKFVTANEFFIHVCEIKMNMHEWLGCGDPVIEKMSAAMVEKFDMYWSGVHDLMALAIILDPRGKMVVLEICYDALFGEGNSEQHVRKSRDFLRELINVYKAHREASIAALSTDKVPSRMEALVARVEARNAIRRRLDNELDRYLQEGNIPYTGEEFDILGWWKLEGGYPILKMIARDIFAIPIARIVSESALCTGGRVLNGHCSHLTPKMLEALICCQEWHQNELQGNLNFPTCGLFHCAFLLLMRRIIPFRLKG